MNDIWILEDSDLEKLRGDKVLLSMSGGKDSTACALLLERHGIPFEPVFMDTGWEHPALYTYLTDILEPRFGKIKRLTSKKYPNGMAQMVIEKKAFPSRTMRFCTSTLKVEPFLEYVSSLDESCINVVGIRREESKSRAHAERWGYDTEADIDVFRPLVNHTFENVITMHQESALPPNPLYLQGASRVGCFPCIYSRKSEIDKVAKLWPDRIDEIESLETTLTESAKHRFNVDKEWRMKQVKKIVRRVAYLRTLAPNEIRWHDFKESIKGKHSIDPVLCAEYDDERDKILSLLDDDPGYVKERDRHLRRTFFHSRADGGIKEVLEWAETDRGGQQLKLFDLSARDGCTRWGMCDSALSSEEVVLIQESRK